MFKPVCILQLKIESLCALSNVHRQGQIRLNKKSDAHITFPVIPGGGFEFIPCSTLDETHCIFTSGVTCVPVVKEIISTKPYYSNAIPVCMLDLNIGARP